MVDAVTKTCPKCRMQVPFDAAVCGHCRAKLKTSPILIGCLAIFGIGLLLSVIGNLMSGGSGAKSTPAQAPVATPSGTVEVQGVRSRVDEVDGLMRDMMKAGIITKVSPASNEIQVSRRLWEVMSLDQKKGFTLNCAQYFKACERIPQAFRSGFPGDLRSDQERLRGTL